MDKENDQIGEGNSNSKQQFSMSFSLVFRCAHLNIYFESITDNGSDFTVDNGFIINDIKNGIDDGIYQIRKRERGYDGKPLSAHCWKYFYEIYSVVDDEKPFPEYFVCKECGEVKKNVNKKGNTNLLNRHKCIKKTRVVFSQLHKDQLKFAAAKFVAGDLRPYNIVQTVNFRKFMSEAFFMGQKYPYASPNDFEQALPCSNTVKSAIKSISDDNRKFITDEIILAKEFKSIAVILDLGTDNYPHNSYLAIVCVLAYVKDGIIKHKKYTMHLNEVEELTKTKEVVMKHLFIVLESYGLSKSEAKTMAIFVSDRGGNIKYGLRDLNLEQIFCYIHMINNIVCAMTKVDGLKDMIKIASELVSYLKKTGLSARLDSTVKLHCNTRWNTVYMMFDSIVKNYGKIVDLLAEKSSAMSSCSQSQSKTQKTPTDYVSPIDINAMSRIAEFLKPFKEMTIVMEGHKYPTLHMVWPAYLKIRKIFDDYETYQTPDSFDLPGIESHRS